jgi:ABC-type lipoprotein export system ATPase subunit
MLPKGIPMAAAVSFEGVSKVYRRGREAVPVIENFNLQIAEGEFVAIMGPSGSGKTTLLNLIGGLDKPSGGRILIAGERIDALSRGALARWRGRHIGFVFQFYNLMPTLSAERNVEIPLLLAPMPSEERKRKVTAALELVGLLDRRKHKPGELSGGQQQRVAIARASDRGMVQQYELRVAREPPLRCRCVRSPSRDWGVRVRPPQRRCRRCALCSARPLIRTSAAGSRTKARTYPSDALRA